MRGPGPPGHGRGRPSRASLESPECFATSRPPAATPSRLLPLTRGGSSSSLGRHHFLRGGAGGPEGGPGQGWWLRGQRTEKGGEQRGLCPAGRGEGGGVGVGSGNAFSSRHGGTALRQGRPTLRLNSQISDTNPKLFI